MITLYDKAKEMASHIQEIGSKLAGNCTTVSYAMLSEAKQLLGDDVRLVIGWFHFQGKARFYFSDKTLESWMKGEKKERYNIHCWLAKGDRIIDLTLTDTIKEIDPSLIDSKFTYIDSDIANDLGIKYKEKMAGDDILFKIGLVR
jgi:hypothetical protein